jgi:hypothetical protein
VTLELSHSYTTPDEKVTAIVKVRTPQSRELTGTDVSVVLSAPQKSNVSFKAVYEPASRCYITPVLPGSRGEYTVTAIATRNGEQLGQDQQLLVSEDVDREMAEVRAQHDFMTRLAKLSGGQSFTTTDSELPKVATAFANKPEEIIEYQRRPLWDKAWLLATVLGLLALEWALRRWKGLA